MRGMILRTVLLCIGTVLAFPTLDGHLPQTIDCPNSDIHVFVNQSAVDRSEYTFVDWNAANLQDCIEKCFGNHFCYSIRFDSSLEHNCGLYYFAAYNCSNQALTKASTIDYKGGSITLDCIRCPGRGDFVTAPPFSSVGEQTIVSETAVLARGKNIKGTATEITHNSEHDGVPHAEVEGDTAKNVKGDEGKEGEKGAIEGSGETSAAGSSTETGGEKTVEEPSASTESTLTGQNPSGEQSEAEGSTAVPSAESSDATTGTPEETAEATVVPSTETGEGTTAEPGTGAATEASSADGAAETTAAPTEEEAGATEAPSAEAEAGSTPAGAETEEPSTVEGSGEEEEEATTPLTGESNGEAESIGEASGEGSQSASESSSRAPGIKPTEGVEGSGVEGSGETPEIGLQEEEEPVKVEVETTTVWNGHTEQPRVCGGNLRFVPSSIVDLDTVQLLVNSTKANSPAECAKICYEHNCGFAYYEPSTFICQFMANTEDLVDSSTCPSDHKDAKYQAEFRTDVASTLTCVVCAKDSEVDKEKPALQPVASPRRGSYPACIISFQAAEGDHSSFPFYKSVQVGGLNECARHCFIGECSQSVYNPKTKECRLGSNPKDTCNNLPIIQKFVTQSDEVLLQCFRCIPEDLIGVKGTVSETTGYREPPTAAESIDESAATANREKEQSAAAAAPTTTPAAETTEAATEAPTTEAEPEETTTIAGTGDEVELREPLPEGVTEAPEETTTVTESTTTVEETTPIGGEEVEIEEASGEEETTTASGEIATSSSGYDSTTVSSAGEKVGGKEGEEATTAGEVEGSGEEGAAAEAGANKDYEASTAAGAASKDEEGETAIAAAGEETTTEGAEGEATTTEGEEATTSRGEEATTAGGEKGTTAGAEGEETTGEEGATTETPPEGSSTLIPEEAATTEAGAEGSTLMPEEAATSEGPGEMSKAIEQNDKPLILASEDLDFGKSCVIKFQSAPFSDRPSTLTAQFEKAFPVDSIELCATRCFQDGCTSAKYEPESKTCHLAYEDKPICDRTELHLRMKGVEGDTWIHCVNCYPEKSVVNDVLGAPLNKTSGEEENAKESVLDKVVEVVSDAAHSVAETITGEKPDLVLKHGCIVNFQTSLSSEMAEKVEYLPPFKTRYAHRCATKCFQEGCAAATFNPTTNECSLGYGRFVKCSNGPLVSTALDVKETVTIHCMSCIHHKPGEGGIDLVVLSPDDARIHLSESQDVPSEEVEGSGTEDSTVSKVEGGESTTGAAEAAESTTAESEEGTTVSGGEEGTTAGTEEGSTAAATEEASTVSGAEANEGEGSSTASSAESTTAVGEESSTVEGSGEVNGGTLGGGEGPLEGPGTGKIKEVPLETAADGVQLPTGVNLEEAEGKVQVNEEGKKFKPELPTGFSIDSGLGKVQVDGKMTDGLKTGDKAEAGTGDKAEAGTGDKETAEGTAGEGEQPAEATTGESSTEAPSESSTTAGEGAESSTGLTTGEEGGESTIASADESASSTETPSESTTAGGETSTAGEEAASSTDGHGIIHPAKEFEHTPLHPEGEEVEVETAETTTTSEGEGATSTSKDSEGTTAATEETTTEEEGPAFVQESPSEDEEKAEEGLSIANDDLKHREGLVEKAFATGKPESSTGATVPAEKPVAAESIDEAKGTVSPAGEEEAAKSTIAPVESSTSAPSESSTVESAAPTTTAFSQPSGGELDAMAAMDETETEATKEEASTSSSEGSSTAAASTDATTPAASKSTTSGVTDEAATTAASTDDLHHREGILEKALASANPAATTKEGAKIDSTTPSSENADSSSSTVEPVIESTVASSTESSPSEGTESTVSSSTVEPVIESTVASSTESSPSEGTESTVSSSTEGSIDAGETTVSASTEGTVSEGGESTVAPIEGMAASIDEKTKAEPKEVEEEIAQKGEVTTTGEKGVAAASLDAGSSTASPSESTTVISTTTVPSPADLAKSQHHEKGGAEFGQTGQKGTEEVHEDAAHKGEVKGTGAGKASTSSSLDVSSTVAPSDTDGAAFAVASDAATGELTTSSSVDGGAGGLAREGEAPESTTSSSADTTAESTTGAVESTSSSSDSTVESTTGASETTSPSSDSTVESTTGDSEGSSTAASSDTTEESSTSSSEGSSTVAASESQDATSSIDSEGLIQKALSTAHLKGTEKGEAPTTAVPSPADLAKSQHHEKGGAEFGQTGQRGSEGVGEQEDEIKSSTIAPVEASTSATGESLDGGIDRALTAIGESTTEPPVQAVKDLLDALASGDFDKTLLDKKPNGTGTEAEKLLSGKTQITEMATPINQKHECSSGKLSFSTFELVDLTTKFEADAIAFSLPHCARLCYEIGCTMAAYSRFPRPLCLMHFEKDEKESHRCNGETNRTSHWEYSSLQQVVAIDCILCEGQTFFGHDQTVDITTLHAIDDSIVTVPSLQGISKGCDGGRIEFQFVPAGSLPRLNVTNDVPARTPADCARKCHETKGCTTAGFIPTPSAEIANGVCLLTSDDEVCISREDAVPQHASVTAFVISCIRCTRCSYTLSHMTLSSSTAKFQHIATVQTIGECAEVCHDKKCVFAQYDATTNTCALSMEASLDNGCRKVEPPLAVKGAYPVRLECVQCKE